VVLAVVVALLGAVPVGADEVVPPDRQVLAFGDAPDLGDLGAATPNQPLVAMVATPTGQGYWLVARDGGVFAFGDAGFHGSTGAIRLNQPIVAALATPTGHGYWLIAADGGVFAFGDAGFHGSTGAIRLNQPVTAALATPTGQGYRLIAADGGVFAFGDATFAGSQGGSVPPSPVVGAAATPSGLGYWLASADGAVTPFGDAPTLGDAAGRGLDAPVVGLAATPTGAGYWLVTAGGCTGLAFTTAAQRTSRPAGSALLTDVAVASSRCAHRVTFTFRPGTDPVPAGSLGWSVGYETGPATNTAGQPVPVAGSALLVLRVFPARTFDIETDPIVETYTGSRDIVPSGGPIREVRFVDDFEALMEWAIGVDVARPVRVVELTDPPRLVVDVATG
jgi:hypothetical protein